MNKSKLLLAIAAVSFGAQAIAAAPSQEEMWKIIQQQSAEIQRLKAQQKQTDDKLVETDVKINATADAVESGSSAGGLWSSKTKIGGYGEHHFNHKEDKDDEVDAHRYVLFVGHEFSDTVRMFSEVELEHGLSNDTDDGSSPGEVELEQAYIEWDFAQNHSLTVGQFLIPVGIINETHEPNTFYGTERNAVEANIIPATWWETGAMVSGEVAPGLSYNVAVHSGLSTPVTGGNEFKIRNGRQKSAKANAEDLAYTGRLKYTGVPGLEVAATGHYQQDITQGANAGDNSASMWEAHLRYSIAGLTATVLRSSWEIDGDLAKSFGRDEQEGWYAELSYKLTERLGIFLRRSNWDNNAGNSMDTEVNNIDFGLNYWLTDTVVLKLDVTESDDDEGTTSAGSDAVNMGVGWSF